jgi:predicted dehydrogenase
VPKLRWGILGAANIARKNWKAIHFSGNGNVVAVASRDLARCREFIAECSREAPMDSLPRALATYEELLAAPDVDALYIPLPTGLRKEWVLRAAAAGKHIVCEKPCATTVADLREIIAACRAHQVQFLDGVMFMHSRRLPRMREVLDDGTSVGTVRRITSIFSFCGGDDFLSKNIRVRSDMEPYGCLGDLGWYCIRFALWTMNWQLPKQVVGRVLSSVRAPNSPASVATEFSGELVFDGGVSSGFYCSFITANEQVAMVSGTKGYLRVSDFVVPFAGAELKFDVNNTVHPSQGANWKTFTVAEHSHGHPTAQETNLFRNFAEQVRSRSINEQWMNVALLTQQVVHACFESAAQESRAITL